MNFGNQSEQGSFESKLDLTPLIDCIFQLILFLVLTSQITLQVADVDLPFALEGKEAHAAELEVPPLVVNVVRQPPKGPSDRTGAIVYNGRPLSPRSLTAELKKEANYDASPRPEGRGRGWEEGQGGKKLSRLSVLVRADRGVKSEHVRSVFEACIEAGIYKLKVSTIQPE